MQLKRLERMLFSMITAFNMFFLFILFLLAFLLGARYEEIVKEEEIKRNYISKCSLKRLLDKYERGDL